MSVSLTNPNLGRVRPQQPQQRRNPYGDVNQRVAGQLAPQTNVPGVATNTQPQLGAGGAYGFAPQQPAAPQPTAPQRAPQPTQQPAGPYQLSTGPAGQRVYGAPTPAQQQAQQQQAGAAQQGQQLVAMGAAVPSLMTAFLEQHPTVQRAQVERSYHDWVGQLVAAGHVTMQNGHWVPTQSFWTQVMGWLTNGAGQIVSPTSRWGQQLANPAPQGPVLGQRPYGFGNSFVPPGEV